MFITCESTVAALKSLITSFWITVNVCSLGLHAQSGNGCGHTLLGTESGTLTSQNYPGTYPSNTRCTWRIRVPPGQTLRLLFGDFDIESSPGCRNGSLVITTNNGGLSLGPLCEKLDASEKNMTINSNEVTVTFQSGPHRSGRGFLLSFATNRYPDLISCLQRGSHFSTQSFSVYCPAGCKNVSGDIWGNSERGYRDTSVLCKSAVHAGVMSDSLGGRVTVTRGRSLTLYESTFANGIVSKMGSLSDKKLLFSQECNNILVISGLNASSFWEKKDSREQRMYWSSRNTDSTYEFLPWAAASSDPEPWLELELSEKNSITGIITTGSNEFYIESFILLFSKDRKNWKLYKGPLSKEKQVFQAHSDGHLRVLNSLYAPIIARYVQLQPLSWHGRASAQVQLVGCPVAKVTPRSRPPAEFPSVKVNIGTTRPSPTPTEGPILVKDTRPSSSPPVIMAVGVVLGLIICVSCLLAGVWWKRRKKDPQMNYSLPTRCQSFQGKSPQCPQTELISYPLERSVHDALPNPPLNDYAEPTIGQKLGSTFRPASDEVYTAPFTLSHYDTPGNLPEYAEPLPPEPEYATPFSEQPSESSMPSATEATTLSSPHGVPMATPTTGTRTTTHTHYDCPSHRMLSNGYCTPTLHANSQQPVSVMYTKPKPCHPPRKKHMYEEPL
ncbi:discoidin, CUB and LCCL domain-containing protein 1 [Thalassophryne amazonica]|uniref:discoidin, CUB and LCCL domain-containing protein 1 n=1 Tax=Thalassophryne amazonica TaxID=390379 RepID=UPI001471636C|nr:discoidin, CUB and LCCL domain-containing protein 1 [Thalassophryne amazonica]